MKLNWGTGLAITLGIFILGMGTVTYKAMNQRHDLVTTDYYAKEIEMYSPTHAEKDFNLSYESWTVASLSLPAEKLSAGKWIAKIHLNTDSTDYYFETDFLLP